MADCLIVGGDSAIGRALAAELRSRGLDVAMTSRRPDRDRDAVFLDLETLEGLDDLPGVSHVALLAAETRFSVCAAEPERTQRINVEAPVAIAARAREVWDARVLFFSSIAVHDGSIDRVSEDARPAPNSLYGEQKLAVEDALFAAHDNIAALRPAKVVDGAFPLFANWADALARGEVVEPFSDMLVSPVWIGDVARIAAKLMCDTGEAGVFQISASDQMSYADIATYIADRTGCDPALVQSSRAVDRLDPATLWLPKSARLDCARTSAATGDEIAPSSRAIDLFLEARDG